MLIGMKMLMKNQVNKWSKALNNVRGTKALKAGQWKNGLYNPPSLWEQLMDK